MPVWALVLVDWLHLIGAVLWLGSLGAMAFLVWPSALKTLDAPAQFAFLDDFQRRLESIGTFCLFLLLASGMFQMSANKYFAGFLSTANPWSSAILAKHLLFLAMGVVNGAMTGGLFPAYRRALIRYRRNGETGDLLKLQKRELWLLYTMLAISALILAATAVARGL